MITWHLTYLFLYLQYLMQECLTPSRSWTSPSISIQTLFSSPCATCTSALCLSRSVHVHITQPRGANVGLLCLAFLIQHRRLSVHSQLCCVPIPHSFIWLVCTSGYLRHSTIDRHVSSWGINNAAINIDKQI